MRESAPLGAVKMETALAEPTRLHSATRKMATRAAVGEERGIVALLDERSQGI